MLSRRLTAPLLSVIRPTPIFSSNQATPLSTAPLTARLSTLTKCHTSESGVSYVTLNNPAKRNALSMAMLNQLISNLETISDSKCVVINSTGSVFSSGHDLKELRAADSTKQEEIFLRCNDLMLMIARYPVPIVSSVDGFATAAGCQLVAACHVAICSDISKFATPGVNIGLFCSTPSVQLGRAVNRKLAMDMLLTGEPISADRALSGGLVSRVTSSQDLVSETTRVAELIASKSKPVIELGIDNFNSQMKLPLPAAAEQSAGVMVRNLDMADGREGLAAFLEKRRPDWSK